MGRLLRAIEDYRYLLNRGYKRETSLRLVGDKYLLSRLERLLLYRCVHSLEEARARRTKLIPLREAKGKRIAVDGYNTLITVESLLESKPLIICDDGFIRDLSAVHGGYEMKVITEDALRMIASIIKSSEVGEVGFFFDAQISRSGDVAALTRRLLAEAGVEGVASAVKQADSCTLEYAKIVASSDAIVIDKAAYAVDLAQELIRHKRLGKLVFKIEQLQRLERFTQLS
ncbi:MAG: DUF434 domain-containing protein [Candidatus Bathyarchaeia archaeon]